MSQQNPYESPQQIGGMIVPVIQVEHLYPWAEPTRSKILKVATHQRWVNIHFLIAILGGILLVVLMPPTPAGRGAADSAVTAMSLILLIPNMICLIYRVYQLSSALEYSVPILMALGSILGIIGIILVALLSSEANKYLKKFNIRVGLLGANPKHVEQMIDEAQHTAQTVPPLPVAHAWPAPPR